MQAIVLDHLDGIQLDAAQARHYHNERQVLGAWRHGLHFLAEQVRAMEQGATARLTESADSPSPGPQCPFPNLGCCFQWYAVTLCNYAELVGCIGHELDSAELPDPRKYLRATIPIILAYRNKVGAHPARARRSSSNAAERTASLLPPSSLMNGRYVAGAWTIARRSSGTVSDSSKIQPWSLTLEHEKLAGRYWPPAQPPPTG